MFHEHVPRPQRTSRERHAIALRSAFLRLVRARTERQQKCSLPQCVTTTYPEPERQADPILSAYLPGPLNLGANCAAPEHQCAARLEEQRHISGYPDAINDRRMEEVLVQGIGTSPEDRRSGPAIGGFSASLLVAKWSASGSFIGRNPSSDRPGSQTLSARLSALFPYRSDSAEGAGFARLKTWGSTSLQECFAQIIPFALAPRLWGVERWDTRFSCSPSTVGRRGKQSEKGEPICDDSV